MLENPRLSIEFLKEQQLEQETNQELPNKNNGYELMIKSNYQTHHGVLWPKFESEEVALNLAFTGTIKEDILQRIDIAYYLTKFLIENEQEKLCNRYKITEEYIKQTLEKDAPENENIYEIMLEIGRKRGCIISGRKYR